MTRDRSKWLNAMLILAILPTMAFADSWDVIAHVTELEPSAVPNVIYFAID